MYKIGELLWYVVQTKCVKYVYKVISNGSDMLANFFSTSFKIVLLLLFSFFAINNITSFEKRHYFWKVLSQTFKMCPKSCLIKWIKNLTICEKLCTKYYIWQINENEEFFLNFSTIIWKITNLITSIISEAIFIRNCLRQIKMKNLREFFWKMIKNCLKLHTFKYFSWKIWKYK